MSGSKYRVQIGEVHFSNEYEVHFSNEYRAYFNNQPATREQMERIERVTVEQEIDVAWEARAEMALWTDDLGNWTGLERGFAEAFSRFRLEVRSTGGSFIPLIDGPIVGYDFRMSPEPGQSSITLIAQDDSVFLNREEKVVSFDNRLDHEVAKEIFGEFEQIDSTQIEDTPATGSALPPFFVQRGTAMQTLRFLAGRQGKHAYVLPGETAGRSIGVFKSLSTEADGFPPLVLLGPERNVETFNVKCNAQSPVTARASTLRITDKQVAVAVSRISDLDLLGQEASVDKESDTMAHLLPPGQGESVDIDQAVAAAAADSFYAFEATGALMDTASIGMILRPYRVIGVKGGIGEMNGDYLVAGVVHTLTRSNYSQSFTLWRNARSSSLDVGLRELRENVF